MCKKFFHPSSADNLKRVWMAQKKDESEKAKQADLRSQYDKEQELYQNKALLSKESKDKLEVNFMYEPPPGCKKVGEKDEDENGEPEYKFEWQRTWGHAPKESYLGQGDDFCEQPFGIQVCQAKCIKCGEYGHMNTDKRCKLYGKAVDADAPIQNVDQNKLLEQMRADGLAMRWSAWDMDKGDAGAGPSHSMIVEANKPTEVDRASILKNMSKKEKKKMLRKLEKMEKKKNKKSKKEKRKKHSEDSEDGSSSDSDNEIKRGKQRARDNSRSRYKRERSTSPEKKRVRSRSQERNRERSRSQGRKRERSRSQERRRERSRSQEKRRERSRSDERRKNKYEDKQRSDNNDGDRRRY